jgi:hypothetical protein
MQALEKAKDNIGKYYNQHPQPQHDYKKGDKVLLIAKNIRTVRPTKKLAAKLYEPFRVLAKLAKVPIDSNSKLDGESTMYFIPRFWNPIERMQSRDDRKVNQNPKRSRENWNMKWSGYFRVKSAHPAERQVEDISPLKAYISWLNGEAIPTMSLHGN